MKNIISRAFKESDTWDLTDYQRMFIQSLHRYYRKFKRLTPAQSKVLMSIWDMQEKTPVDGRGNVVTKIYGNKDEGKYTK
jgi:DNA-binding MarR family transcriptional regulator